MLFLSSLLFLFIFLILRLPGPEEHGAWDGAGMVMKLDNSGRFSLTKEKTGAGVFWMEKE